MLEYFLTISGQIFSMALMVIVGFFMYKTKLISDKGIKDMSALLLKVVMVMIVTSSFQREFEAGLFIEWCTMLGASALTYFVSAIIAELAFLKKKDYPVAESKLGVVLPNCGFLAFPLIQALAGDIGIFMGSTSVVILNVLQWTYGAKLINSDNKIGIQKILVNPGTFAVLCSLVLFVSPWKLPQPVFQAVDAIGSLNTPLAMILLGAMLAQTDIKAALSKLCYYKIAILKLLVVPAVMLGIFTFIPLSNTVRLVAYVCAVVPSATSVSMISQYYDSDFRFATNLVVITSVLSIITMPVLLTLGKLVMGY